MKTVYLERQVNAWMLQGGKTWTWTTGGLKTSCLILLFLFNWRDLTMCRAHIKKLVPWCPNKMLVSKEDFIFKYQPSIYLIKQGSRWSLWGVFLALISKSILLALLDLTPPETAPQNGCPTPAGSFSSSTFLVGRSRYLGSPRCLDPCSRTRPVKSGVHPISLLLKRIAISSGTDIADVFSLPLYMHILKYI